MNQWRGAPPTRAKSAAPEDEEDEEEEGEEPARTWKALPAGGAPGEPRAVSLRRAPLPWRVADMGSCAEEGRKAETEKKKRPLLTMWPLTRPGTGGVGKGDRLQGEKTV